MGVVRASLGRLGFTLLPLLIALALTSLMILALGDDPWRVYRTLVDGFIGRADRRADTLVVWVSLAIVSSGLLITFRAGQWNIGIEGQVAVGALFSYGAGRLFWESSPWLALPAMILWGMVGGALWAMLAGLLKVLGGVNEIFGGLGLNFVATSLTIYLVAGPWKPIGSSSVSTSALLPRELWMPTLAGLRVSPITLAIAALIAVMVYLALRGTLWGLQLKAVGRNLRGAYLLGVPTRRVLLSAYLACGACAGLAGALLVTAVRHQVVVNISSGYGFLSILIVLLSGFNGALTAPIALFFAALGIGGATLPVRLGLDSSLGGVLVGIIVLVYELTQGVRGRIGDRAAVPGGE